MKTIRKWEWVRDNCIRHDFKESAEIADQIGRGGWTAHTLSDAKEMVKDFAERVS